MTADLKMYNAEMRIVKLNNERTALLFYETHWQLFSKENNKPNKWRADMYI